MLGGLGLPIFWNHFVKLQIVLFWTLNWTELQLIINNVPLTYVYRNSIKTCLTPNYLLFGKQLLYYSNTASTVVRDLNVLSSTTDEINRISNHFWDRLRLEYVMNLRETELTSNLYVNYPKIMLRILWWRGAQTLLENCHSNRSITLQRFWNKRKNSWNCKD